MKINTLKMFGCAALSLCFALVSQAQSVSSTPVGYVTYTVNANSDLKLGIPMEQASSFTGSVSSVSAGVVDAGSAVGDLTTDAHFLKVTSGTLAGNWYEVTAASGNTITVADDLAAAGLAADDTFQVTPFWTLNTLFPSGGNVPQTSNIFGAAEALVLTFDPNASGTNLSAAFAYAYDSSGTMTGGVPGWVNVNTFAGSDSQVINPDLHLLIRNNTANSFDVVIAGTVPSASTSLNIVSTSNSGQDNLVYNPFPADITLGTSNLYESGAVAAAPNIFDVSTADIVLVYDLDTNGQNPSTSAAYVYDSVGTMTGGVAGWINVNTFAAADNAVIKAGQSIIIRKAQGSDADVSWTVGLPYSL